MRLTGLYPLLSQGMFLRSGFYCCDKSGEICVSNDSSIMHSLKCLQNIYFIFQALRLQEKSLKNGNTFFLHYLSGKLFLMLFPCLFNKGFNWSCVLPELFKPLLGRLWVGIV